MPRISYVNGRYANHFEAFVHIEDRGYQFSDGVYEVIAIQNGVLIEGEGHFVRLERSLKELHIPMPMSRAAMLCIVRELLRRNHRKDGCIYIQVTRGVAKRDHAFPKHASASLVMTLSPPKTPSTALKQKGIEVISRPDIRWGRRDIKSISLLPNILAKQEAIKAGAKEAWLVDEKGFVTEGSSTNCYIIQDQTLVTHPANERILGGITRDVVLQLARKDGVKVDERPFTLEEAKQASEAFVTSTTLGIMPVVKIDEMVIGNGHPRDTAQKLMSLYDQHVEGLCKTA